MGTSNLKFSKSTEVEKRETEIQLLINIQEPDSEYQPVFISDEATIFDVIMADEKEIRQKFSDYFQKKFTFNLSQPLWKLVDEVKQKYSDWPEDQ